MRLELSIDVVSSYWCLDVCTTNTKNNALRALSQLYMEFGLGFYIQRVGDRNIDVKKLAMLVDITFLTCFLHSNIPYTERLNIAN